MNIQEGNFYKISVDNHHGWILAESVEDAKSLVVKECGHSENIMVELITDGEFIDKCIEQIKTSVTFH